MSGESERGEQTGDPPELERLFGGTAALLERLPVVVYVADLRDRARLRWVSPQIEDLLGYPPADWTGDSRLFAERLHPGDRDRVLRDLGERFAGPEAGGTEFRLIARDGRTVHVSDRCVALDGDDGVRVTVGMITDVSERQATEVALAEARERSHAAFVNSPVGTVVFSLAGETPSRILEANPAFCAMVGYQEAELLDMSLAGIVHPDDAGDRSRWDALVEGRVASYDTEPRLIHSNGSVIWSRMRVSIVRAAEGTPEYGVAQAEDIGAWRSAEGRQAAVAELSQLALEGAGVDQLMHAAAATVEETLAADLTGVLEYELDSNALLPRATGKVPDEFDPGEPQPTEETEHLRAALAERRPVVVEDWATEERFRPSPLIRRLAAASTISVPIQGPDGAWGVMAVLWRNRRSFTPDEVSFVQAVANVLGAGIQRRLAEEDARHRALHDPLTGLPNRTLFLDRLGQALERSRRSGARVAVLFMDLDQFKVINDSLGHEAGDRLLCAFAPRLREALRPSDTVARFGGDEFVVLCEDLPAEDDAVNLAERILDGLREPFTVDSHELYTSATIGLALARSGESAEGLIRDADAAMYRAKGRGRARFELFDEAMRERVSERLRTESALRRALPDGALAVDFQPIVALDDRSIVGAEALLRWNDPARGPVPPDRFIPIAEESGLIVRIGEWALEEAARQALAWPPNGPGGPLPHLSVNLSARQVVHPLFCRQIEQVLARTGFPPERLSLEITESVLIEEAEGPVAAVRELKSLGVRLVLDDFGTGYSSLSYLNRLPIDVLKLDRSFIAPLREDGPTTTAIVSGVVMMAEALGMTVVAEGVEEASQLEKLRGLGCDFAQGFLFARPMPAEQFDALLRGGPLPLPEAAAPSA